MANKDKEEAGYLQSVALNFKLLGVGLELGTFGYRAQSSNHSTTPPTIPDKIVDTSPLPPIQCWSTLSSGRNSLVGLLIAEPTLNRGEGGEKKIVSGSSGGNTMCMTDDISKNGQN